MGPVNIYKITNNMKNNLVQEPCRNFKSKMLKMDQESSRDFFQFHGWPSIYHISYIKYINIISLDHMVPVHTL